MCLKGLINANSELLYLLRLNGCAGVIPTERVYRLSDIHRENGP